MPNTNQNQNQKPVNTCPACGTRMSCSCQKRTDNAGVSCCSRCVVSRNEKLRVKKQFLP